MTVSSPQSLEFTRKIIDAFMDILRDFLMGPLIIVWMCMTVPLNMAIKHYLTNWTEAQHFVVFDRTLCREIFQDVDERSIDLGKNSNR